MPCLQPRKQDRKRPGNYRPFPSLRLRWNRGEKADALISPQSPAVSDSGSVEVVRVSAVKLNSLLLQVEELRAPKMALGQHLTELRELGVNLTTWTQERAAVRSEVRALHETLDRQGRTQKVDGVEDVRQKTISQIARLSGLLERNSGITDSLNSKVRFTSPPGRCCRTIENIGHHGGISAGRRKEISVAGSIFVGLGRLP